MEQSWAELWAEKTAHLRAESLAATSGKPKAASWVDYWAGLRAARTGHCLAARKAVRMADHLVEMMALPSAAT